MLKIRLRSKEIETCGIINTRLTGGLYLGEQKIKSLSFEMQSDYYKMLKDKNLLKEVITRNVKDEIIIDFYLDRDNIWMA